MHALDGAYIRFVRAEEHLIELRGVVDAFLDGEHESARQALRLDEPGPVEVPLPKTPVPLIVSVLIGEIVYNLRACLDYLIYELAIIDSGSEQGGTQFPIEDTQEGFRGRRRHYLKGINDAHAAAIERLQPYNGVDWSKYLRTISNPDKHRHLIIGEAAARILSRSSSNPAEVLPFPDEKGISFPAKATFADGFERHVQLHFAFFIIFDDGLPIIDTLEHIKLNVADTLADFKTEF